MVSLIRVCGNGHLPLGQSELEAQIGRTLSLLPIPPHAHCTQKGGRADLLRKMDGPAVKMARHSVIAVKGMAISLVTVDLRISTR